MINGTEELALASSGQESSFALAKVHSIGHSAAMGIDVTSTAPAQPRGARTIQPSSKFVPLARLRKLRECEQVAAICYRTPEDVIEFLLVRTRGGRWIFPKGNAEPGLTHAQAAALEAFEEAGVHGRIEEACFTRYTRHEREARNSSSRSSEKKVVVNAYLCEVLRLEPPQEFDRSPTWFSPEKTKRRLQDDRSPECGAELSRVIDRALARIRRSKREQSPRQQSISGRSKTRDQPVPEPLQKVQFIDAVRLTEGRGRNISRVTMALP